MSSELDLSGENFIVFSSDEDSQCEDTPLNSNNKTVLSFTYGNLDHQQRPQPLPRTKRNNTKLQHTSDTLQTNTENPSSTGNSHAIDTPMQESSHRFPELQTKTGTGNTFYKEGLLLSFGTFVICLIICQSLFIFYVMDANFHLVEEMQNENRDLALKLILELQDVKDAYREASKSFGSQNALFTEEILAQIKKVKFPEDQRFDKSEPATQKQFEQLIQTPIPKYDKNIQVHDKELSFRKSILALKSVTKSQFHETWIELFSGIIHTMTESTRPAAIILLVPTSPDNYAFATCFAKKLVSIINTAHGMEGAPIKEIDLPYWNKFSTLTEINDDLEAYLENVGKTVLVYDVDQIIREDFLMIFHSFCDNIMAFDKTATFIFILQAPKHLVQQHGWTGSRGSVISRSILHDAWKSVLMIDTRAALIGRIVVNVVSLQEGDSCI